MGEFFKLNYGQSKSPRTFTLGSLFFPLSPLFSWAIEILFSCLLSSGVGSVKCWMVGGEGEGGEGKSDSHCISGAGVQDALSHLCGDILQQHRFVFLFIQRTFILILLFPIEERREEKREERREKRELIKSKEREGGEGGKREKFSLIFISG